MRKCPCWRSKPATCQIRSHRGFVILNFPSSSPWIASRFALCLPVLLFRTAAVWVSEPRIILIAVLPPTDIWSTYQQKGCNINRFFTVSLWDPIFTAEKTCQFIEPRMDCVVSRIDQGSLHLACPVTRIFPVPPVWGNLFGKHPIFRFCRIQHLRALMLIFSTKKSAYFGLTHCTGAASGNCRLSRGSFGSALATSHQPRAARAAHHWGEEGTQTTRAETEKKPIQ